MNTNTVSAVPVPAQRGRAGSKGKGQLSWSPSEERKRPSGGKKQRPQAALRQPHVLACAPAPVHACVPALPPAAILAMKVGT